MANTSNIPNESNQPAPQLPELPGVTVEFSKGGGWAFLYDGERCIAKLSVTAVNGVGKIDVASGLISPLSDGSTLTIPQIGALLSLSGHKKYQKIEVEGPQDPFAAAMSNPYQAQLKVDRLWLMGPNFPPRLAFDINAQGGSGVIKASDCEWKQSFGIVGLSMDRSGEGNDARLLRRAIGTAIARTFNFISVKVDREDRAYLYKV